MILMMMMMIRVLIIPEDVEDVDDVTYAFDAENNNLSDQVERQDRRFKDIADPQH